MRKFSLLLAIVVAIFLCTGSVAYANFAIHGGYVADTDACAGCHRAHTATSGITWLERGITGEITPRGPGEALLVGPATLLFEFCYVCHGSAAPGAATDVESGMFDSVSPGGATDSVINAALNGGGFSSFRGNATTSFHMYNGASWPAWGESGAGTIIGPPNAIMMDCGSCHDPHGSTNYRILKDIVNAHEVGRWSQDFVTAIDPDPLPYVISSETGYPLKGTIDPVFGTPQPTHGFRLHRQYPDYRPNYTTARYGRGEHPVGTGPAYERGMSGWCIACHENYMTKIGVTTDDLIDAGLPQVSVVSSLTVDIDGAVTTIPVADASNFEDPNGNYTAYIGIESEIIGYTNRDANSFYNCTRGALGTIPAAHAADTNVYQAYDAGDGYGPMVRHRHPMNVPFTVWQNTKYNPTWVAGDRALILEPSDWQAWNPAVPYVDIPVDHDPTEAGVWENNVDDWIECLTCHRAHGTDARMLGFANASLSPGTVAGRPTMLPNYSLQTGVNPAMDSALLRADNRGVCERCHNK
ncbi:MAG: cytochrome c3 family protein [Actinomycetota bacterium]|nr:cytochrome c3 family protein [Actinomycetota bacterium]